MDRTAEVDLRYLRICREYAQLTRCLSRKVGALLVSPNGIVIGMGMNGPPRRTEHCPGEVCPRKLKGTKGLETCPAVHAEVNAILACGQTNSSTSDCSLYIYPLGPCKVCAGVIINAGVRRIVFPECGQYDKLGPKLLAEAGVEIQTYHLEVMGLLSCTAEE